MLKGEGGAGGRIREYEHRLKLREREARKAIMIAGAVDVPKGVFRIAASRLLKLAHVVTPKRKSEKVLWHGG